MLLCIITPEELQKKNPFFSNKPDVYCFADKISLCWCISLSFCLELSPSLDLICFYVNVLKIAWQSQISPNLQWGCIKSELVPRTEFCISVNLDAGHAGQHEVLAPESRQFRCWMWAWIEKRIAHQKKWLNWVRTRTPGILSCEHKSCKNRTRLILPLNALLAFTYFQLKELPELFELYLVTCLGSCI